MASVTSAAVLLEPELDEDEAIKLSWGRNIDDQIVLLGLTNKAVATGMRERGADVSVQAIGQWRKGQKAPTPANMVALSAVLRVAPRVLFSLDVIRVAA